MNLNGFSFNPKDLTLNLQNNVGNNMPPPIRPPVSSYSTTTTYYSPSLWEWFNNGVSAIGKWLQETGSWLIPVILVGIPAIGGIIWALVVVGSEFVKHGFWNGLVALIIMAIIASLAYVVLILAAGILSKIVYLLAYIFSNAWSLLITLALAGGIWLFITLKNSDNTSKHKYQPRTEQTVPTVTWYRCTATVLNVRAAASTQSKVLGTLRKGDSVSVIGFEGDFAKINWHSQTAYVSREYIVKAGY